jgi:hypothetical protein
MRRHGARAFSVVLLYAFHARPQTAAQPAGPQIRIAQCDDSLAARLPAVVKLEIDVLLRERGPARAPPDNIVVRCEAEKVHIEVTLDGSRRASTIDLHVLTADHRARAVGLAAAELVHAMAARPREVDAPIPAPPAASRLDTAPPSRDELPRSTSRSPALFAGALAEWRGSPAALLFGARVAFRYPLGELIAPELSVDASFGSISPVSAKVAIESASAGAHLYFGTTVGRVRWDVGPGGRLGWSRLTGEPAAGSTLQGDSLAAAWGGPEVRARVAYAPSSWRPALCAVQIGAGFVALPMRGLRDGSEEVYAMEGAWVSVGAEVGLGL